MRILIATDSFKGCLSSKDAGEAIGRGILKANPDAEVKVVPISDGGEGLTQSLKQLCSEWVEKEVTGTEFKKVTATYGINKENKLAVIEMAAAAGLPLVKGEKEPKKATTYGVGELIKDAISKGVRSFIIGIGGSATNDGGVGMLAALGYRFYDKTGAEISPTPLGIKELDKIDITGAHPTLKECEFTVACDVDIPLCGENGCSYIFAPQKGATPQDIADMDEWLQNYAELTKKVMPDTDPDYPGSGAAGGMGFALKSYLGATLKPGIDIVISALGLEKEISDADIIITGEGKIDSQTARGKVVSGISHIAKKYGKRVMAFCGATDVTPDAAGVDEIYAVTPKDMPLEVAMQPDIAAKNIEEAAERLFKKIFKISSGNSRQFNYRDESVFS